MKIKKGLFITFEGCDGCGKTTQLNLLAEFLKEKGHEIIITKEPGAEGLGEKIRELLLNYNGELFFRGHNYLNLVAGRHELAGKG